MSTPQPSEDTETTSDRPDLRVVPDPDEHTDTDDTAPADVDADVDDAGPVLDSNGDPVTPQAPLDVQLWETLTRYLRGIPAFGQPPPSFADAIEYSQTGDWATSDTGAKRAAHGLATVIAFLLTYPLVDLLGKARTKPGPFLVAVLIAIALINVLALAL